MNSITKATAAALLAVFLAACGGGDDDTDTAQPVRYCDCQAGAEVALWYATLAAKKDEAATSAEVGCTPKEKQP